MRVIPVEPAPLHNDVVPPATVPVPENLGIRRFGRVIEWVARADEIAQKPCRTNLAEIVLSVDSDPCVNHLNQVDAASGGS